MKKIALLFTIICVGQLYGMEAENIRDLTRDIHYAIIDTALTRSKSLPEALNMIQKLSILHGVRYDNLNNFTNLVHKLADKFNVSTLKVANEFKTPVAEAYVNLAAELFKACQDGNVDKATQLINKGADVNHTRFLEPTGSGPIKPLLNVALSGNMNIPLISTLALIRLLLDAGAQAQEPLDAESRRLLEEAMKK